MTENICYIYLHKMTEINETNQIKEIWKQVPIEFTYGEEIFASNLGNIQYKNEIVQPYISTYARCGHYSIMQVKGHTLYFHRLVFYAHSDLPVHILKQGRVIFKNKSDIVDKYGMYRNWYEDLLFEKGKNDFLSLLETVSEKEGTHPIYGAFTYGKWQPLRIPPDEMTAGHLLVTNYELVLLDNSSYPLLVRNKTTGKLVKYHFNNMHDGYISITYAHTPKNYQITHIILASVFPHVQRNQTVDHMDDNPLNHTITNLQWLSYSENSRKGAKICIKKPVQNSFMLPDEVWKPLPINEHTADMYMVSNRGRVKNTINITVGSRLRGKKYRHFLVSISTGKYVKYYIHHLVYLTFHGPIADGCIVLHDDTVPLNEDGTYRNWAEDLRLGNKTENNHEHHSEKRTRLIDTCESPANTIITPASTASSTFVIPTHWRTESIYNAYITGNIGLYKEWCETSVTAGEKWNTLWSTFIKSMEANDNEPVRRTVIEKFIRKLRKDRECEQRKQQATPAPKKWTIETILSSWSDNPALEEFKSFQETYTGDEPDCPKWEARWNTFTTSLANAESDMERKTLIKKFTYAQRTYVYRLRHRSDESEPVLEPELEATPEPAPEPEPVLNSLITPPTSQPKQWKVKQVYEHFHSNRLDEYKIWCETANNLSGPEWDSKWYGFTLELQASPNRLYSETVIKDFIEDLRKQRHDALIQKRNHEVNPLERDTRQQWPSISVLRAWKEDKLHLFKEFQENYTGDEPTCPVWHKRWNKFVESLETASTDDERKTLISKFMTAQRTRVFRAKSKSHSQTTCTPPPG